MIETSGITLARGDSTVLNDVSVTTADGRILGLVGPNGAGKSTLLNTMHRLLTPDEGVVRIEGDDVTELKRNEIARRVSVVAQHAEPSLPLPVRDSVALGRLARRNLLQYGDNDDMQLVDNALKRVGLADYAGRLTTELSGGELQRVLIARAIVQQATHLLLDEPTNHLDIHHQYAVLELIRDLQCTTVIVLHDLNLALRFCDEIALLDNGTVVSSGKPSEVLTAQRVKDIYHINADVVERSGKAHLLFSPSPTQQEVSQ